MLKLGCVLAGNWFRNWHHFLGKMSVKPFDMLQYIYIIIIIIINDCLHSRIKILFFILMYVVDNLSTRMWPGQVFTSPYHFQVNIVWPRGHADLPSCKMYYCSNRLTPPSLFSLYFDTFIFWHTLGGGLGGGGGGETHPYPLSHLGCKNSVMANGENISPAWTAHKFGGRCAYYW